MRQQTRHRRLAILIGCAAAVLGLVACGDTASGARDHLRKASGAAYPGAYRFKDIPDAAGPAGMRRRSTSRVAFSADAVEVLAAIDGAAGHRSLDAPFAPAVEATSPARTR